MLDWGAPGASNDHINLLCLKMTLSMDQKFWKVEEWKNGFLWMWRWTIVCSKNICYGIVFDWVDNKRILLKSEATKNCQKKGKEKKIIIINTRKFLVSVKIVFETTDRNNVYFALLWWHLFMQLQSKVHCKCKTVRTVVGIYLYF